MFVIGTAGHVDHGKSTLVKALTGIDPDRLQEEKDREMTIDLGFAWLTLPSGREVSVVDVPGHERFIKNMLAGVHGLDLAMLVVAADESVMPQTREHLAILDLLRVQRGLVVLSKKDLVDADWLELVRAEVEQTLSGTTLAGAPVVAVSSVTGDGIAELKTLLDKLLDDATPRRDVGRPRLPVDRAFVMTGFGPVVTGTLIDGAFSLGQEVELAPSGLRARIRGLQSHQKRLGRAEPGRRTAVNLSGVEHAEVQRGDVLTTPGWLHATDLLDVSLRVAPSSPLSVKHNMGVTFHTGTSETQARVRLLDAQELKPGSEGWAQVHLEHALPVVKGDFFVIRASDQTLGGGTVADPAPSRHRRFQEDALARLEAVGSGSPRALLLNALDGRGLVQFQALVKTADLSEAQAATELKAMATEDPPLVLSLSKDERAMTITKGAYLIAQGDWARLKGSAQTEARAFHAQYPLRRGLPKEDLRSRLNVPSAVFGEVVARMTGQGTLAEDGAAVRLPDHQPRLSPEQQRLADAYVQALEAAPFSPPTDRYPDAEVLAFMADEGRVVRFTQEVVFGAQAYAQARDRVLARLRQNGKIAVSEVRDVLGTSRKYALALMEYLDQQHVTRRMGDERVLVGR
ncbi:MAG: selenocysteine-specific translation elongation factor [Dehalococcoidia bacterium]|nr:selenocysteine-specific translation elongation factor [Dehalococcoidia bacterium]